VGGKVPTLFAGREPIFRALSCRRICDKNPPLAPLQVVESSEAI
jgi:hypothetical protein